jgi:hypothetical protein
LPNTLLARVNSSPERSIATIVFSKVGGAGFFAIASICLRCAAMPASSAGLKCSSLILSKGGRR